MGLLEWLQNVFSFQGDGCTTILTLLLVAVIVLYNWKQKSAGSLPLPGPISLPLVGYIPFLGHEPHKTFAELKKKHGPIFKVQMGSIPCVVIGNYETVKEAFIKQGLNFAGRPHELSFRVFDYESAFIYEEGDSFKYLKMFSLDALKKIGFGRSSLEPLVKMEVQQFVAELKKFKGKAIDVDNLLALSSGNAICSLLTGRRCEYNDPWLNEVLTSVNELLKTYTHDVTLFFPWIRKVPLLKKFSPKEAQIRWKSEIWRLWEKKFEEVRNAQNNGDETESFINCWFLEKARQEKNNQLTKDLFSVFNLKNNVDIFCQAALETTSTTLLWAFHFLLEHPQVQKKLQNEIDELVGTKGEDLGLADINNLPYFRAFIQETHRMGSIVSLGVFHCNLRETKLSGFHIPKRTVTISNIYAIHHDDTDFPEPFYFKPERFISEKGEFIHSEKVIPFSIGKRSCPGEAVAQLTIFIYLTRMLRTFELKSAPRGSDDGDLRPKNSVVVRPDPFKLCFIERQVSR